ncbi:MAG: hypothetical protein AAF268_05295 [Cyanobacteria bacterium P01_A01_bin.3]
MALKAVFIDCTTVESPEISQTELLWAVVEPLLQQQGCDCQQIRAIDQLQQERETCTSHGHLLNAIADAAIVILGTPVIRGSVSAVCVKTTESMAFASTGYGNEFASNSSYQGKIVGLLSICDEFGLGVGAAGVCFQLGQLGFTNPPNNVVAWSQTDPSENFSESKGAHSYSVNRDVRLLAANVVAYAKRLQANPIDIDRTAISKEAKAIATEEERLVSTKYGIRPIRDGGVPKERIEMRTWVVMQAGILRGFEFTVLNLSERLFRAEKQGKGFVFEVYPGHLRFRLGCQNYDREKSKVHKLQRMRARGLPVPISYGVFQRASDIPYEHLDYPVVAKPDSGSISENVFVHLQTQTELQQAAIAIEVTGKPITVESFIRGQDYRITIVNGSYVGCVLRRPASIVGNGQHSIIELFHIRNQEPNRGDRYDVHTTIHKLVWDSVTWAKLADKGYTTATILPSQERFNLQEKITAATGSDYVDVTDEVHPSTVEMCINFALEFETLTLGFDIITRDISQPLSKVSGVFNEYNVLPYLDLHERCNQGVARPAAGRIWDYIEDHFDSIVTPYMQPF